MNNFPKSNLSSLIDKLKHNKTENKPVFFVGSAVSMFPPANLPSGGDTAGLVKKKLQCHSPCYRVCPKRLNSVWKDITFEGILELYSDKKKIAQFIQSLYGNAKPNGNHTLIAELLHKGYLSAVITTNFDECIEDAIHDGLPVVWNNVQHKQIGASLPHLFKIHGHVADKDSLIYSIKQEGRGLENWKIERLQTILNNKDVFFVGYSGIDFDICPELIEIPIKEVYWLVFSLKSISDNISEEAQNVVGKFRCQHGGYLEGDMRGVFSCIASELGLHYDNPGDRVKERIKKGIDLFEKLFADKYENHIWLIKVLNEIGVGGDALKECNYLLEQTKDLLRLSLIYEQVGKAHFNMGRYKSSTKYYDYAIKTYKDFLDKKIDQRDNYLFGLELNWAEAIRCQRIYGKYRKKLRELACRIPEDKSLQAFFQERLGQLPHDFAVALGKIKKIFTKIGLSKLIDRRIDLLGKTAESFLNKAIELYNEDGNIVKARDVEYRKSQMGYGSYILSSRYKRLGYAIGRVNSLRYEAEQALENGSLRDARNYIIQSIRLAQRIKDYPGCTKGYKVLRRIKEKEEKSYTAKIYKRKSKDYSSELEGIKVNCILVLDLSGLEGITILGALHTLWFILALTLCNRSLEYEQ